MPIPCPLINDAKEFHTLPNLCWRNPRVNYGLFADSKNTRQRREQSRAKPFVKSCRYTLFTKGAAEEGGGGEDRSRYL
eukprot:gene3946-2247_t